MIYLLPRPKKRTSQKSLQARYDIGDPFVGLLDEPSGKFDYYVLYGTPQKLSQTSLSWPSSPPNWKLDDTPWPLDTNTGTLPQKTNPEIQMMHPPSFSYDSDFPPLETFTKDQSKHIWKIKMPTTLDEKG